jgi:hypothetical protein
MSYSDEEIEAAVEALNEPERLAEAEAVVERAAPGLQRILAGALASGGWFADSHEAELRKVVEIEDPEERATALRTLLAEETRMGMMIGVAVGWALREELND